MRKLKIISLSLVILFTACQTGGNQKNTLKKGRQGGYSYQYVKNDPMKTRIYTLDNGLKVYLSNYEDEPRMQILIPVKAGSKFDPADNTGLAHYLEHMMFKGTSSFGTTDWEMESVLLDSIEQMFNHYGTLTDPEERKNYYTRIDGVSKTASEYAIPNEYDKMISLLGGSRLNAYTTEDRTVYMVDIPSNELERFLMIEGNRFQTIVNRLFHTELEAVYEEKNRSLDNDFWQAIETLYGKLFQKHPYGTQTTIGKIEHLKNPSITAIKNYFKKYYIPNNVAICISGDIDYTKTIKSIDHYFGSWEKKEMDSFEPPTEDPILNPIEIEVWGPMAEFVVVGFRFNGRTSNDYLKLKLVDMILSNQEAGLIDLNLKQEQKVLDAGAYTDYMNDYSVHAFYGFPKEKQSPEEVKDLLLNEVEKLKKGEFDGWLLEAVITDFKKSAMKNLESNYARANNMVTAFTNGIPWNNLVSELDELEKITKKELVDFANENYGDNYIILYKRSGENPNKQQVEKPDISKVSLNRDSKSVFHNHVAEQQPPRLKPVFLDYDRDIIKGKLAGGIELLMKENKENKLFSLTYLLDFGSNNNPAMKIAVNYLEFIGTEKILAKEFKKEMYKLGCSFSVHATDDRTYVVLSGLDENMEASMTLFESLLNNPKQDQEALEKLVGRTLKGRSDTMKDKGSILWSGLYNYAKYGEDSPYTNVLSNQELRDLKAEQLTEIIRDFSTYEHRILYYGPRKKREIIKSLNEHHLLPDQLIPIPELVKFEFNSTEIPKVFWAEYDMTQTEIIMLSKGDEYNPSIVPEVRLFNEYYGGGMNSVVFQEIRESQGLAYAVYASYSLPRKMADPSYLISYLGTQADKQPKAMNAMMGLMDDMPLSELSFNIAKESILSKLESERITKSSILWNYERAKNLGLDYDIRKNIYSEIPDLTIDDLGAFFYSKIKSRNSVTVLMGDRNKIDFGDLEKYGKITELSLENIFGYEKIE